jgi:hypothetical protein
MASIFKKVVPAPCGGRELSNKLSEAWEDDAPGGKKVFDSVVRIFVVGLLGAYDHCATEANFALRRQILNWYHFSSLGRREVEEFIATNPTLTMFLLREMYFFTVSLCTPLERALSRFYYWNSMKRHTYEAMEKAVRGTMNDFCVRRSGHLTNETSFFSGDPLLFHSQPARSMYFLVDSSLKEYHKTILTFTPRRVCMPFSERVKEEARLVDVEDIAKKRVGKKPPPDASPYAEDAALLHEIVMEATKLGVVLPYDRLLYEHFGVSSAHTLEPLKRAQALYESETKPTLIPKVLKNILAHSERDYVLVKAFFSSVQLAKSIRIFPLPSNVADMQRKVFADRFKTPLDTFGLPEMTGNVFVCSNCFKIKTAIAKPGIPRDPNKGALNSPHDVSYDLLSRRVFCGKSGVKKPQKKKVQPQREIARIAKQSVLKAAKKEIREEMDRERTSKCPCVEVILIDILGKALKTERHGIVLFCPMCGRLTAFHRDGFKHGGAFSCGCVLGAVPKKKADPFKCTICNPDKVRRDPIFTMRLAQSKDSSVKYEPFCTAHPCHWVELWNLVLSKSTIRASFYNKWTSKVIDTETGERTFLDHSGRKTFSWEGTRSEVLKSFKD